MSSKEWKYTHKIWEKINETNEVELNLEEIEVIENLLIEYHQYKVKENELLHSVINWVDAEKQLPKTVLGVYLVCLKNEAIMMMYYSDIKKGWWCDMGDVKDFNPVKYWAELPKPPCL